MMMCINCGYITIGRIKCPKCGGELKEVNELEGEVLASWKLNVTPEGQEESYYLNAVDVGKGLVICKSKEKLEGKVRIMKNECEKGN